MNKIKTDELAPLTEQSLSNVFIKKKNKIRLIPLEEVYYFQAENKQILVVTATEKHQINGYLNNLESRLAGRYLRIHRNTLIAIQHFAGIEKDDEENCYVYFRGIDEKLKISRRCQLSVNRWLKSSGIQL